MRVYVKPFVDWIWGGCLVMALGGLLAASDRRYRATVRARGRGDDERGERGMKRFWFLIPLAAFLALAVVLAVGLKLDPREVPSPLIDKPAPKFALPRLDDAGKTIRLDDLRGKVWVLNVWASWCVACREEHPLLVEFAKKRRRAALRPQLQGHSARTPARWLRPLRQSRTTRRCSTTTAGSASTSASTACPRPSSSTRTASSA